MYLLSDYNYNLPKELIAQEPVSNRAESKLLCLTRFLNNNNFSSITKNKNISNENYQIKISHKKFTDLYDLLNPADLVIINDTKVIQGRLLGQKETGGKVEILILDYIAGLKTLENKGYFACKCLIKASKRPKDGSTLLFNTDSDFKATVLAFKDGIYEIRFSSHTSIDDILDRIGKMPLPPYINRDSSKGYNNVLCDDEKSYQTVYASNKGAIAAPTAGLHFTDNLLTKLNKKGIKTAPVTLHVGYGTFLPVRVNDIRQHKIHSEWFSIPKKTATAINKTKKQGGRVIAVGTTSVRTLEYVSDENGHVKPMSGSCDIFIYPGYKFKLVDAMITNFHLPNSTLLMLVSAFTGRENILQAYHCAIDKRYRFFSYGDAMLII